MSKTFGRIIALVEKGDVRISDQGYDELANDDLFARDVVDGIATGVVVEDYPEYHRGPSVLVLRMVMVGRFMSCGVSHWANHHQR